MAGPPGRRGATCCGRRGVAGRETRCAPSKFRPPRRVSLASFTCGPRSPSGQDRGKLRAWKEAPAFSPGTLFPPGAGRTGRAGRAAPGNRCLRAELAGEVAGTASRRPGVAAAWGWPLAGVSELEGGRRVNPPVGMADRGRWSSSPPRLPVSPCRCFPIRGLQQERTASLGAAGKGFLNGQCPAIGKT